MVIITPSPVLWCLSDGRWNTFLSPSVSTINIFLVNCCLGQLFVGPWGATLNLCRLHEHGKKVQVPVHMDS